MTDGNTCTCRGYAAMHKPHPHADRDGSESRAQLEREHERGLAAYVPDEEPGEVARLRHQNAEGVKMVRALTDELMAKSDRAEKAEAALARVEMLHAAHGGSTDGGRTWAHECLGGCGEWPCMTALAIYPDAEQKLNDQLRAAFADPDVEDAS